MPVHSTKILTLLLFFTLPLYSQIKFDHITVNDGLNQSAIHDISQDSSGYLWLGTRDGLSRYDGRNFEVFRSKASDKNSIANNEIWRILTDSLGGVWMATRKGLSYYHPQQNGFLNYEYSQGDFPKANDLELAGDSLMVATEKGLYSFNMTHKNWNHYSEIGEAAIHFVKIESMGSFIISMKHSVIKYSDHRYEKVLIKNPDQVNFQSIIKDDEEVLLTDGQYFMVCDSNFQLKSKIKITEQKSVNVSMTKDQHGKVWISANGIFIIHENYKDFTHLQHDKYIKTSLSNNRTTQVYVSDDGTVWVGTNGYGLNKYNERKSQINTIKHDPFNPNSLSNIYVSGINVKDSLLYVGLEDQVDVLDIHDYPPSKYDEITLENSGRINDIIIDEHFQLFGGEKGLFLMEKPDQASVYLTGNNIHNILEYKPLNYLILTNSSLYTLNIQTKKLELIEGLPTNLGYRTVFKSGDSYWVGTIEGVIKLDKKFKLIKNYVKNKDSPGQIKCINKLQDGKIWVGTWGSGLYWYNESHDTFIPYEYNDELPNSIIYSIMNDAKGNTWYSTNAGIVCKNLENDFIRYSVDQGLQSNEFNTNSYFKDEKGNFYYGGIYGISFFNPDEILSKGDKTKLFLNSIWYEQQKIPKDKWFDTSIEIPYYKNNVRFDFSSVNFSSSFPTQYRYNLNDNEYATIGDLQSIYLNNLQPGKYTLKINATDAFGIWQNDVLSYQFIVAQPFWMNSWFLVLSGISILLVGYLIYQYRIRTFKKRNELLEEKVKQRTWEITEQNNEILTQNEELSAQGETLYEQNNVLERQRQELVELKNSLEIKVNERTAALEKSNDELKHKFTQLEQFNYITSHNLRGPIASLKGLIPLFPQLEKSEDQKIMDHVARSIYRLDNIITHLGEIMVLSDEKDMIELIEVNQFIKDLTAELHDELEQNEIEITLQLAEKVYVKGVKTYLHSILYNLISNSIKYKDQHKKVSRIIISTKKLNEQVIIEVEDNGIGMDMKYAKDKIFKLFQRFNEAASGDGVGLYMVKIQVEAMYGKISVESKLGEGTVMMVKFPVV